VTPRSRLRSILAVSALALAGAVPALAVGMPTASAGSTSGIQHLHFRFGPVEVKPGQNNITYSEGQIPKPKEDGWIVRIAPNIRKLDGTVPPVDVLHLHHGVWLNTSHSDVTVPRLPERFFAAGEEKTVAQLPSGYGYSYKASDRWLLNYMIHNLTPGPFKVWMTYDLDFIPARSSAAKRIQPARPIWMDVQNGSIYPVFDVHRGSGQDGTFTYPDQAQDPYHGRRARNTWTVDRDGVLVGTAGHLHPGGLHDDLSLQRAGASAAPGSKAAGSVHGDVAHLFRSTAHYWEPAGAVSWDVAMTATAPDWRVAVHKGDVLMASATYDSKRASWYESMGIMIAWMADGPGGADPFKTKVDRAGHLTHGHLPENNNHGGKGSALPDALKLPSGPTTSAVDITNFEYGAGDLTGNAAPPVIKPGQSLTFKNLDAPKDAGIWHSITACRAPCNRTTGVAYPVADGDVQFDSGQLGVAGPPTASRTTWSTPTDLAPGTYTYFCRIHPFMRGSFRIASS